MKLVNMTVNGFVRVEDASLDFTKPTNLCIGANRAGKSTLAACPEWVLTGKARGIAFKKDGVGLIHDGADRAEVTLTLDDGLVIRRSRTQSDENVQVIHGDEKLRKIPPHMEAWAMGINPSLYFALDDAKRTQFIFDLVYPDRAAIAERVKAALLNVGVKPEQATELSEAVRDTSFATAEGMAVDRRRQAKRQVPDPPDLESAKMRGEINLAEVASGELDELMTTCEGEKTALIERRGRLGGARPRTVIELELGKARKRVEAAEEASAIDVKSSIARRTVLTERRSSLGPARDEKVSERARLSSELEQATGDIQFTRCPNLPIDCPVPMDERRSLKKEHDDRRKELGEKIAAVEQAISALDAKAQECTDELSEIRDILDTCETAKKELSGLKDRVLSLETELEKSPTESREGIEAALGSLEQRIENGRSLIEAKKNYDKLVIAAEKHAETVANLEKEIAVYDQAAKLLSPDGIQKELTEQALGKFRDRITETSAIFGDTLALDSHFMPQLNGHHWSFLSGSEKWLAKAIFQEAIAHLSGCPWLIMDEIDILDRPNRNAFMEFLIHVMPQYSTILAFITLGDVPPQASEDPNVDVWIVESGKAVKLMSEQAAA